MYPANNTGIARDSIDVSGTAAAAGRTSNAKVPPPLCIVGRSPSAVIVIVLLFVACATSFHLLPAASLTVVQTQPETNIEGATQGAPPAALAEPAHALHAESKNTPETTPTDEETMATQMPSLSSWDAEPLRCYAANSSYFYDDSRKECRKLHFVDDGSAASGTTLPTDPTLVPIQSAHDSSLFGPAAAASPSVGGAATPAIAERFAPSPHSRWLHEDWRLWEGELPCSNRAELGRALVTPHTGIYSSAKGGRTADPLPADVDPRHAPFVTRGHHRDRLPSSLYELENACIDEESGRLYAFAGAARAEGAGEGGGGGGGRGLVAPDVRLHEGAVEFLVRFTYVTMDRFLHRRNRETVPIVLPEAEDNTNVSSGRDGSSAWRRTIAASLAAYLRPSTASPSAASSPAASVLFVEDTALMMPLSTIVASNPGHMYQRVANVASHARLLGARSIVYLSDYVSLAANEASYYTSTYHLNEQLAAVAAAEGLEALLPPYLQSKAPAAAAGVAAPTIVRASASRRAFREPELHGSPIQAHAHFFIHNMATALATGNLVPVLTPVTLAHPLHMSGERGCEAMRCAGAAGTAFPPSAFSDVGAALARGETPADRHCPVEEVADLRRCGRRHIAINVAPPMPYDGILLDTEGHSSEVWSGAVKETMREGRRVRADLLAATAALSAQNGTAWLPPAASPLPANAGRAERYAWYQRLWRARLVSLIAHRRRGGTHSSKEGGANNNGKVTAPNSKKKAVLSDEKLLKEYFADFMGAQLELRSRTAKEEAEAEARHRASAASAAAFRRRPKQLVCYRSIVVTQNHRGRPRYSTERGTLSISNVPTCHDAEGLKNAYEAVSARFATCPLLAPAANPLASAATVPAQERIPAPAASEPPARTTDYTQSNNTNRDAHPLLTLPPADQSRLAAAFAASQATVEAVLAEAAAAVRNSRKSYSLPVGAKTETAALATALLSDISTVDLGSSVPAVAALFSRVEAAQRAYDDVMMSLLKRSPIKAYGAVRLQKRGLFHTRSLFAAMADSHSRDGAGGGGRRGAGSAEGGRMADYLTVEAQEGMQPEGPSPRSLRASQYRRGLTADVLFGPHGADMHATAFVKPSALVLEVDASMMDDLPRGTFVLEYGFFSQLAFARSVGYLRVNSHADHGGDLVAAHYNSGYLSLPEWRHTMANAVCSWLAFNAVRLGDESRKYRTADGASAAADFSHLVPWWCRGGPIAVVEGLRAALRRERLSDARPPQVSPTLTAHSAAMRDTITFLRRRSARSAFGFSVPNCPPLEPSVAISLSSLGATTLGGDTSVRLGGTSFGQAVLNRLQTECARPVTRAVHDAPERQLLRAIEALQSHVEMARLRVDGTEAAALLSFLAVHGTGALLPEMPFPRQFWKSRRGEVSVALLGALLDGGASPDVPAAFRAAVLAIQTGWWEGISDARNAVPNAAPSPLAPNASSTDRQFVLDFLRDGVAAMGKSANPQSHRPQDTSSTFSYGTPLKCPNPLTPPYFKSKCNGNLPRFKFP